MAVMGFEVFRERFASYSSSFCLIGGSACDLLFDREGVEFRTTKDLDIVVIVDEPYEAFAQELWSFVKEGKYTYGWRNDEKVCFYRFSEPEVAGLPFMIELFARHPDFKLHDEESEIAPLPVSDEISSLSAIILDDDYYAFLREGIDYVDGIGVVDPVHLLPLKAKAHLDLNERKAAGQHVNEKELKKHKNDVLRLTMLIPLSTELEVASTIYQDIETFLEMIKGDPIPIHKFGLDGPLEEHIERIRAYYRQRE